jgi:DNA polymerase I-like protein with 3'-5' exonuclease and polymerase domains
MSQSILFNIRADDWQDGQNDVPYLPSFKGLIAGRASVKLDTSDPMMPLELVMKAKEKGCTAIATCNLATLKVLLPGIKKDLSLDNYAGSIIKKNGMEFLIVNPVEHLVSVPYGRFLYERYWSKLLHSERWFKYPDFSWNLFNPKDAAYYLAEFKDCTYISSDIETGEEGERNITCIGFTGVRICPTTKQFTACTVVVPFTDTFNVHFARTVLQLSTPKLFQNGQYDNAYLLRYNSPTTNWAFDTQSLFHAWYSELPKRLDFITSFTLRDCIYWKNMSSTGDQMQYWEYNARDCFNTAMAWLSMLQEVPEWALRNFIMKFPNVFPSLTAGMTGVRVNTETQEQLRKKLEAVLAQRLQAIRTMVATPSYNPNSPKQTKNLFVALGCEDIKSTGKTGRDKAMNRHPLNKRILTEIGDLRADTKSFGSYVGKDFLWGDRLFYAINPDGTDTGRNSSKDSFFWCGLQIQNIPRVDDKKSVDVKDMVESDNGFHFGESDYSNNEGFGTAFQSGDPTLLDAVQNKSKDFHGWNASKFFGVPYEQIINSVQGGDGKWRHSVLNKPIRQVSKNTNHGSAYNMGAEVMVDTMGIQAVLKAKKLLKLPARYSLKQVCQYLLDGYKSTYSVVKGAWYENITNTVTTTHLLVGPTGWTRYCFGNPAKNKRDLNKYVAHLPQSLAAMILNKAWYQVFVEVYLPNTRNFKLCAQIHDSIWFQYRIGYEHLAFQVKYIMENMKTEVTDIFGKTRTMQVPVDLKGKHNVWSKLQTMEVIDLFTTIPETMPEILFEKT